MHWFLSLDDAYEKIGTWVNEYNNFRPHSSLDDLTPAEMVEKHMNVNDEQAKYISLPAASHHEAMHFSTTEHESTASENAYLHDEIFTPYNTPISPT